MDAGSVGNHFNVEAMGGGKFEIDGKEMNIESLFLYIANELSLDVQTQMKEQTGGLQIKNEAVTKLNEYISKLSDLRSNLEDGESTWLSRARSYDSSGKNNQFLINNRIKENKALFDDLGSFSITGKMDENGKTVWDKPGEDFGLPSFDDSRSVSTHEYWDDDDGDGDGSWKKFEGDDFDRIQNGVGIQAIGRDYKMSGPQMDAYIQKLKGKVEELNSNSQLEMIDLQELVSQNNRLYDMASNIISKAGNNRQTIAGNIRG